jgi:zinc transporter ZupT
MRHRQLLAVGLAVLWVTTLMAGYMVGTIISDGWDAVRGWVSGFLFGFAAGWIVDHLLLAEVLPRLGVTDRRHRGRDRGTTA